MALFYASIEPLSPGLTVQCKFRDGANQLVGTLSPALTEIPLDSQTSRYADTLTIPDEATVVEYYDETTVEAYLSSDPVVGTFGRYDANGYIMSSPQTPVFVNPAQITAGVLSAMITTASKVKWMRGDAGRLTVTLGAPFAKSGAKFYLCIKQHATDENSDAIVNDEITIDNDALASGHIDLTESQMAAVGIYAAEIERRDSDGVSNPMTCWRASWEIVQDVRR